MFCVFNGSHNAISLCVHVSSHFYDQESGQCQLPIVNSGHHSTELLDLLFDESDTVQVTSLGSHWLHFVYALFLSLLEWGLCHGLNVS